LPFPLFSSYEYKIDQDTYREIQFTTVEGLLLLKSTLQIEKVFGTDFLFFFSVPVAFFPLKAE